MQSIIRAENVGRKFISEKEVVEALKGINISVEKRALTILKGRSGSGKTTLMNIFGALDMPSSGHVYFEDTDIASLSEKNRDNFRRTNIGFVFQSVALVSMMSAYENVEFGLRVAGYDPKTRKSRSEECLSLVGLGKRMHHRPHEMTRTTRPVRQSPVREAVGPRRSRRRRRSFRRCRGSRSRSPPDPYQGTRWRRAVHMPARR